MSIFLWPTGSYALRALPRTAAATAADVEAELTALFPQSGHPVAVSSGRAGLALALTLIGLRRADLVEVPPYASHCVLDAVSRNATPLAAGTEGRRAARVVYHQWGYVQPRATGSGELIEDACDSLCRLHTKLFPLSGRFEVWSLPKILGCASGGIVWCRSAEDAADLRRARDSRRAGAGIQLVLRITGARFPGLLDYWAGREALCGYMTRAAAADVLHAVAGWESIVAGREARLDLFGTSFPDWLPRSKGRLPCVIPAPAEPRLEAALHEIGITIGRRHFERVHRDGTVELVPVLPIPIHQGAPLSLVEAAAGVLSSHRASSIGNAQAVH